MALNVFLSRPTKIAGVFEKVYSPFENYLSRMGIRPCRLGGNRYTLDTPLKGVVELMKTCKGAIILGYPQYRYQSIIEKAGKLQQIICKSIPTPWNHIEATLAFHMGLPILIIAHENISGGVFDYGVTGQYILTINLKKKDWYKTREFKGVFKEWRSRL